MNTKIRKHKTFYEKMQQAKAEKRVERERRDYKSDKGIARWWQKDGAWHVALPCTDPDPQTGLKTGGFLWTASQYDSREAAILAINLE